MKLSIKANQMVSPMLAILLIVSGTVVPGGVAQAQSIKSQMSAEDALRAGLAAQKTRRHEIAVGHFSQAISAGSLSRKKMMYALYRRAISNRAQNRPAQAISDLNGALYFKSDLSAKDRADAIEERVKAFKDVGLQPTSIGVAGPSAQWKASARSTAATTAVRRSRVIATAPPRVLEPVQAVKSHRPALSATAPILAPSTTSARERASVPSQRSNFQTRVVPNQSRVNSTAVISKPPTLSRSSSELSLAPSKVERGMGVPRLVRGTPNRSGPVAPWKVATKAQPVVAVTPVAVETLKVDRAALDKSSIRPVAKASPAVGVGPFFSSLFSGPSSGADRANPIATASTKRSGAISSTSHLNSKLQASPAPAALQPDARGKLEIVVAVLRNKYRAEALAQQLMVQYAGGNFWSAKKQARVVVVGNPDGDVDALHSVRYGVYDNRESLATACARFEADGLGCEVVRR